MKGRFGTGTLIATSLLYSFIRNICSLISVGYEKYGVACNSLEAKTVTLVCRVSSSGVEEEVSARAQLV